MRNQTELRAEYVIHGQRGNLLAIRNFAKDVLGMSIQKVRLVEPGAVVEQQRADKNGLKTVRIQWVASEK